jgi:hypothetical protein
MYRRNLMIALPFTILLLKFLVRWGSREKIKDVFKSLLTIPLDFIYIALGLLLAVMAHRAPVFISKYASDTDADLNGALLIIILVLAAVLITWLDRFVRMCFQKSFAAWAIMKDNPQLRLPEAAEAGIESDEYIKLLLWVILYWTTMALVLSFEVVLSFGILGGILRLVTS